MCVANIGIGMKKTLTIELRFLRWKEKVLKYKYFYPIFSYSLVYLVEISNMHVSINYFDGRSNMFIFDV